MTLNRIYLAAFILVALVQLYIPAKMIFDREKVLDTGTEYRFKTAPVDPNDPFRGKYITLRYLENSIDIHNDQDWKIGETVYVLLTTDSDGFAKIRSVSKSEPVGDGDFIEAKVTYTIGKGDQKLFIDYPFDRYYMDETKAEDAELAYRETMQDSSQLTYALVYVQGGEAVLKDVMINDISIHEWVK